MRRIPTRARSLGSYRCIGLRWAETVDAGWYALFEILPRMHLGVVNATDGSQRPIACTNKGAIFSIETDDVERCLRNMKLAGAASPSTVVEFNAMSRTLEFKMSDPGGYTIEFFMWVEPPR